MSSLKADNITVYSVNCDKFAGIGGGYKVLEYIESDGTYYLNTEIIPANLGSVKYNYNIDAEFSGSGVSLIGSRQNQLRGGNIYLNAANVINLYIGGGSAYNNISYNATRENFNVVVKPSELSYTFIIDSLYEKTSTFSGSALSTQPFYLFSANINGSITEKSTGKIYSFRFYSDDVKIFDGTPVLHKKTNQTGLLNTVNYKFHPLQKA